MVVHGSVIGEGRWRIRHNKNFLVVFLGKPGSGKSYACLRLAEEWDPTFNMRRVCYSPLEFLRLITNHLKGIEVLPKGAVIVVEEAGVQYSSRAWQSVTNRVLGAIAQSFRSLNFILLFNLPNFPWFEKQARELTHLVLIAKDKMDFKKGLAWFDVNELGVNHFTGETHPYYPWWVKPNGTVSRMCQAVIRKPSDKTIKEYEEKKLSWQTKTYEDLLQKAEAYELKEAETYLKSQLKVVKAKERLIEGGLFGSDGRPVIELEEESSLPFTFSNTEFYKKKK
jgi:hypothetical protein